MRSAGGRAAPRVGAKNARAGCIIGGCRRAEKRGGKGNRQKQPARAGEADAR